MKKTILSMLFLVLATPAVAEPLAVANGDEPGIRAEVTDLKRGAGDVVTLKFTIVNESKKTIPLSTYLSETGRNVDVKTVSGVHLADPTNKRKMLVIRDEAQNPLCSAKLSDLAPGARASFWAKFPAPASDVSTVSVVIPHFEPLDDVPVR